MTNKPPAHAVWARLLTSYPIWLLIIVTPIAPSKRKLTRSDNFALLESLAMLLKNDFTIYLPYSSKARIAALVKREVVNRGKVLNLIKGIVNTGLSIKVSR